MLISHLQIIDWKLTSKNNLDQVEIELLWINS